jgi:hypothetical protein
VRLFKTGEKMKSGTQSRTALKVSKNTGKTPKKSKRVVNVDNKKKRFLKALSEHCGNVTKACQQIKISRALVYDRWIKSDPKFEKEFDLINESEIDKVEDKLKERINGVEVLKGVDSDGKEIIYHTPPDTTAIIFYLKTKGQKRGYIEKQHVVNENKEPMKIIVENAAQKKIIEDL